MRRLSKEIYVLALAYTIILLVIGFLLGNIYSNYWEKKLENKIISLSDISFTSEILYALEGTEEFCSVYPSTIREIEEETWRIGVIIDNLEKNNELSEEIKKKYFEMELRDFFLTLRAQEECNISPLIILYFYSNNKEVCLSCSSQGYELTIARNEIINNKSTKIYAFDGTFEHSILNYLKNKYKIRDYPSIVLIYKNNTKLLRGFSDSNKILEEVNSLTKPSFS